MWVFRAVDARWSGSHRTIGRDSDSSRDSDGASGSNSDSCQRQQAAAGEASFRPWSGSRRSPPRMQQPPGHGAHLVEELEGRSGAPDVDRPRSDQQPEVGVDFFR